jgi:hypothetical protein
MKDVISWSFEHKLEQSLLRARTQSAFLGPYMGTISLQGNRTAMRDPMRRSA